MFCNTRGGWIRSKNTLSHASIANRFSENLGEASADLFSTSVAACFNT
jgi:hypothetical protein